MTQLDLFEKPRLVSRWKGDGPYPWKDSGCWAPNDPNGRFFDGTGWCQMLLRWCDRCDVWHPVDFDGQVAEYRHTVGMVQ